MSCNENAQLIFWKRVSYKIISNVMEYIYNFQLLHIILKTKAGGETSIQIISPKPASTRKNDTFIIKQSARRVSRSCTEPLHPPRAHVRTPAAAEVTHLKRVGATDQEMRLHARARTFKMPPKHSRPRLCPQSNGIERSLFYRSLNAPRPRARLLDGGPSDRCASRAAKHGR